MIDIKDGGPAFPHWDGPNGNCISGLSMRDYFAAKAMLGMNANPELLKVVTSGGLHDGSAFQRMATKAYEQADAMLAARQK